MWAVLLAFVFGWGMNGIIDYIVKARASNLRAEIRRLKGELEDLKR